MTHSQANQDDRSPPDQTGSLNRYTPRRLLTSKEEGVGRHRRTVMAGRYRIAASRRRSVDGIDGDVGGEPLGDALRITEHACRDIGGRPGTLLTSSRTSLPSRMRICVSTASVVLRLIWTPLLSKRASVLRDCSTVSAAAWYTGVCMNDEIGPMGTTNTVDRKTVNGGSAGSHGARAEAPSGALSLQKSRIDAIRSRWGRDRALRGGRNCRVITRLDPSTRTTALEATGAGRHRRQGG